MHRDALLLTAHTPEHSPEMGGRVGAPTSGGRLEALTHALCSRRVQVHSGRDYRRVKVTAQMVGHKYGEFVLTRKVRRGTARAARACTHTRSFKPVAEG